MKTSISHGQKGFPSKNSHCKGKRQSGTRDVNRVVHNISPLLRAGSTSPRLVPPSLSPTCTCPPLPCRQGPTPSSPYACLSSPSPISAMRVQLVGPPHVCHRDLLLSSSPQVNLVSNQAPEISCSDQSLARALTCYLWYNTCHIGKLVLDRAIIVLWGSRAVATGPSDETVCQPDLPLNLIKSTFASYYIRVPKIQRPSWWELVTIQASHVVARTLAAPSST